MGRFMHLALCLILVRSLSLAQWHVGIESGLAFQAYNDVRIPNETGTSFNFNTDFKLQGPVIPFRANLGYTFSGKNHLFALYAPLGLSYKGTAPRNIQFQNTLFEKGLPIEGYYKFNSYRLGYRRDVLSGSNWVLGAGFTAKIRDASIQLSTSGSSDIKENLGFVPLLHVYAAYRYKNFTAWFEGDGLAGGPGRAFDLFAGARYTLLKNLDIKAGYRFLEGGANVSEVYNFTLVNFAVMGLTWNCPGAR